MAVPLSVLDLAPVSAGMAPGEALRNSVALARRAEALGFHRFWVAEHHAIPSIASAAPDLLMGHIAAATTRIRVGSGGVMLPNHAPLVVAERFAMLEALHPGRVDLGLGRAPGTDPVTAHALRRSPAPLSADDFPQALQELFAFFRGDFPAGHPYAAIRALPAGSTMPPVWLLGSSLYSAQVAALLGLPFAFAFHFAPDALDHALALYRERFTPSEALERPHALVCASVLCAPTDEEADRLALTAALAIVQLRAGRPEPLVSPEEAAAHPWTPAERAAADAWLAEHAIGAPATVRARLDALLARTGADELMVTTLAHAHADRLRSLELVARALELGPAGSGTAAAPVAA